MLYGMQNIGKLRDSIGIRFYHKNQQSKLEKNKKNILNFITVNYNFVLIFEY